MEEISAMTSKSSELCFSKEEFTSNDFSVDKFVSEYRKQTSLENLKEDLGLFLKVLQSAMVELINKDYADFVNLSTNLVGLDKSIKNLSMPLQEVKEEITTVQKQLDENITALQKLLIEKESIHSQKMRIYCIMKVLEGIDNIEKQKLDCLPEGSTDHLPAELVERIAIEFNQIQFHMNQSEDVKIIKEKESCKKQILTNLMQHLGAIFLKSLADADTENLHRVLRIYSAIDRVAEVENLFQRDIVRPFMKQVVNEEYVTKNGIEKMYQKILDFVPERCSMLLKVTRAGKRDFQVLKSYDFLVNSVWPEVVLSLEYIGPFIFAPGNPKLFHKNYSASMDFLNKFEHLCVVQTSVQRLRDHPSYKTFMDKWNLHVYYEIRFQEIGGSVETAFLSPFTIIDNNENFHLNLSASLWQAIKLCWDPEVFIQPLCDKFWKLTLNLLSRYYFWAHQFVELSVAYNPESQNPESPPISITTLDLVRIAHDVEYLASQMIVYYKQNIFNIVEESSRKVTKETVDEWQKLYGLLPIRYGDLIARHVAADCSQHLKLIADIPRLYRKTNREMPWKPSGYVNVVFLPLDSFLSEIKHLVSEEWQTLWSHKVIDGVIGTCLCMTGDVITSVKKMEDSLKRLKKARDKPQGPSSSGTISDDDKIRKQLVVDVEHLGLLMLKYGISPDYNTHYKKLEDLVTSAMRSSTPNS